MAREKDETIMDDIMISPIYDTFKNFYYIAE